MRLRILNMVQKSHHSCSSFRSGCLTTVAAVIYIQPERQSFDCVRRAAARGAAGVKWPWWLMKSQIVLVNHILSFYSHLMWWWMKLITQTFNKLHKVTVRYVTNAANKPPSGIRRRARSEQSIWTHVFMNREHTKNVCIFFWQFVGRQTLQIPKYICDKVSFL